MEQINKQVLEQANAAVAAGDHEGFLKYCTDDTVWEFVGDQTLRGKEAVRTYMAENYQVPPKFAVDSLIGEGDQVVALGQITLTDPQGVQTHYDYCDVWTFRQGKLHTLRAFVSPRAAEPDAQT